MNKDEGAPTGVLGWVSIDGRVVCVECSPDPAEAERLTGRGDMAPLDARVKVALAFGCHVCNRMLWDVFNR